MSYWIFSNGALAVTDTGANIIFDPVGPPPPPLPDGLERILKARSLFDDPIGAAANGIVYAYPIPAPDTLDAGTIVTAGDGIYYQAEPGGYQLLKTSLKDGMLYTLPGDAFRVALFAVQRIIAMARPDNYVQAYSIAGKSVTFPSYADFLQYYKDLKAAIQALNGGGLMSFDYCNHAPDGTI